MWLGEVALRLRGDGTWPSRGVRARRAIFGYSIRLRGETSRRDARGSVFAVARAYQAVAVAASLIPSDSSQRSASIAALQPSAAAVTAWR
jgi:hypothetical protein